MNLLYHFARPAANVMRVTSGGVLTVATLSAFCECRLVLLLMSILSNQPPALPTTLGLGQQIRGAASRGLPDVI